MKATALSKNSIHTSLQRYGLLLIPLMLGCFVLLPRAQAVGPDTDGSIPGSNNGEGIGVLVSRTTGVWNTGTGFEALNHLNVGGNNTATGVRALFGNTTGSYNTADGVLALSSNTTGVGNVASGYIALRSNGNGGYNTANGLQALSGNIAGSYNVGVGAYALAYNTVSYNTATGFQALYFNTTGNHNTAMGYQALYGINGHSSGIGNTAMGDRALYRNTTGSSNTAIGHGALGSNTTGSGNIALAGGSNVTTASNVICIGATGQNLDTSCYIGNIFGVTSPAGAAVFINANNRLGTTTSSRRFKEDIQPMDKASEALLALKPVAFRYKKEVDPAGTSQFGLVAEEVEQVNPDLVVHDKEGKPYSVRYDQVNAMLLNEFLKEHRKVEELKTAQEKQQAMIAQQQKDFESKIAYQQKQIEALTTGLQKVSGQLELSKSAQRTVFENR